MFELPLKRPFQWRVLWILVALYFLGNLGGVPLLQKTNVPIEPLWFWGVATLISAIFMALSLWMANRIGLGAPLLEGRLSREGLPAWLRRGLALTALTCVIGTPFSLIPNLNIDPATYPFGWELLPASFKAGVVEELVNRLFLISLFVWVGGLFFHNEEGRPNRSVYWVGILLAGLMFGWGHVDARLGNPVATFWDYTLIMVLNSALGFFFGWLFWKMGIEWAMFAHFVYDAFISMVVIPVYLLKNPIVWVILIAGLIFASWSSWRSLSGGAYYA